MDAVALATELRDAEIGGATVALFTERFPHFDFAAARAVARERDALRLGDGDELVGYKLGWTTAAMREALGIDRPNWGTLWRSQQLGDEPLRSAELPPAKVEPELVYIAGRDLAPDADEAAIMHACAGWAVGLDIVAPRFGTFRFDYLDNTADNSSATRIIATDPVRADGDPAGWTLQFGDGTTARSGEGALAMGSPVAAVRWLLEQLASEDATLRSGQMVFTGGLTAPFDVTSGGRYRAEVAALDSAVELHAS